MAETKFESKVKTINKSDKDLFEFVTDFTKLGAFIPKDKIENWQATKETCSFTIPKVGDGGLEIVHSEPCKMVKYGGTGNLPFALNLWIQFVQVAPNDTKMKLTIKADLNMMMKMSLKKPLQQGVDQMADQLTMLFNNMPNL